MDRVRWMPLRRRLLGSEFLLYPLKLFRGVCKVEFFVMLSCMLNLFP